MFFPDRLIPESARWLLMHRKSERLKKLIVYASKTNRIELKEDVDEIVKKLMKVSEKIHIALNVPNSRKY